MKFWMGKTEDDNVSTYDGAIFLCNRLTRKECFERKLFGLSADCAGFIQKIKAGATLFLYNVEQRKLHGVFEATSDGAMNIIPHAYISSGKAYPSQIRFKRIWFCRPLMESEFQDALQDNYFGRSKLQDNCFGRCKYGPVLSHQQVVKLLHLFSSRNRLQPRQNPRLQHELAWESEMSSLISQTNNQCNSNSSSRGSLKSPCTSSTLGEHTASLNRKFTEPVPLDKELQSDLSAVAKSNNSRSSLHTGANTDISNAPSNEEAMYDKSTDDFIPLQLEDDTLEGVDYLSDLLEDDSQSSEYKDSSDSEDHATLNQPCNRKEDSCYPPMENSKLRSDNEGRTSVFSRLIGRPVTSSQRKKFKTKASPSVNAKSASSLTRRGKWGRGERNKLFPYRNDGKLDMPSANRMNRALQLDYSFVWGDDKRSTKSSGENPSKFQTHIGRFLHQGGNKLNVSTKGPDRYDACKKLVVPEGGKDLIEPCEEKLNIPPEFAEVHESSEVAPKDIRTPFLDYKRRANDQNVEGSKDFRSEDVEQAATKKRLASGSFHQEEYRSDTALVPKGTEAMDIVAISDGICEDKSISLSSKDTCTQIARAYLETDALLRDGQHQRIQGCCEAIIAHKSLIHEYSESSGLVSGFRTCHGDSASKTSLFDGTSENVATCHQETSTLPQHQLYHGCCVDPSSVLEYSGTIGTGAGDRHSEHKASCDQKDDQVMYTVTGFEDHGDTTNISSPDECRSTAPHGQQEYSEAVTQVANSSFVVRAEGYGSKSGISADMVSSDQLVVTGLLGTNSESRISFFDDFPSISGSSSEETLKQDGNGSEVSAEMARLQHDPGEEMKPL